MSTLQTHAACISPELSRSSPSSFIRTLRNLQFIVRLDHVKTHVIECLYHENLTYPYCRDDTYWRHRYQSNIITSDADIEGIVLEELAIKAQLPRHMLRLHNVGQIYDSFKKLKTCETKNNDTVTFFISAYTHIPILGGKGGFGTLLKGQSKQAGARQTTDFGACRDLNGRRLRHINDEIKLQKWRESMQRRAARKDEKNSLFKDEIDIQEEIQALKTSSGVRNWHLMVPNWGSGAGDMSHKHRKREEMKLEREIQKWAREENEKIAMQIQKKREWEQLKVDYASAGLKCQEEVLNDSILEGINKRRKKITSHGNDIMDQVKGQDDGTSLLKEITGAKSSCLCTLAGDIVVQQTNYVRNDVSSQNQTLKDSDAPELSRADLEYMLLQSKSEFATAAIVLPVAMEDDNKSVQETNMDQRLYYEIVIETGGIAQVGWAFMMTFGDNRSDDKRTFSPNSDTGDGVGDDIFSYGFDGLRGKVFHNGNEISYGPQNGAHPWKKGDVIGCLCDQKNGIISFTVNGHDYGKAFEIEEEQKNQYLWPVVSMNEGEVIGINIGPNFCHAPQEDHQSIYTLVNHDDAENMKTHPKDIMETSHTSGNKFEKDFAFVDLEGIPLPLKHLTTSDSKEDKTTKEPLLHQTFHNNHRDNTDMDDKPTTMDASQELNLDHYNSAQELESLGMDRLKEELFKLGCKCGGSLRERSERLFSIKGLAREQIPPKIRGKNFYQNHTISKN